MHVAVDKNPKITNKYNPIHLSVLLRHVGPTSLQYRISFDVGNRDNPKALMWP
jgi:hypothetical protein